MTFQFGGLVLDSDRRELRLGDKVFEVEPQVFDLLEFLVRNRDRVVSKDDLLAGVWGGRIVSESAIAARINAARRAIGDDGKEQRWIRTVSRKGFRFVGEVREGATVASAGPVPRPRIPKAAREQRIAFCRTADGVNLAIARVGRGLPLVCPPILGTHLRLDWENPTRAQLWKFLADRFELIRYDGRGWGLSDRNAAEISPAACRRDLETVIDALGVSRYALFCVSDSCAAAIAHAASHPERVARLIIQAGSAQGVNKLGLPTMMRFMSSVASTFAGSITRDWGKLEMVLLRTVMAEALPGLSPEQVDWCADLLPKTTTLETALRHFSAFADYDVVDLLPKVAAPTLVLQSRHCRLSPLELGYRIAASMPNARLVPLETANIIPLPGEPAWLSFLDAIETFLSEG